MPDLACPVDGSVHPILKVDAIKYLTVFRGQLNKQQLLELLPKLVLHLGSSNYVVYTWTAYCIERILAMKLNNVALFSPAEIAPLALDLLTRLFNLISRGKTPEKLAENDYLMKCISNLI